jgi:hypothetical protein
VFFLLCQPFFVPQIFLTARSPDRPHCVLEHLQRKDRLRAGAFAEKGQVSVVFQDFNNQFIFFMRVKFIKFQVIPRRIFSGLPPLTTNSINAW